MLVEAGKLKFGHGRFLFGFGGGMIWHVSYLLGVLAGPRISPLGLFATRVAAPRLPQYEKLVPGPPKRFAQAIGVAFSVTGSLLWLTGATGAARVVVAMLAGAAFLEAAFGFCLGCKAFAVLMRVGVIPDDVCAECNDLSLRIPGLAAQPTAD